MKTGVAALGLLLSAACQTSTPPAVVAPTPSDVAPTAPGTPTSAALAATRPAATSLPASTTLRPRVWIRAGFRLVRDDRAKYRIVLGEAAQVQQLCRPYDVYGKYSCQNGPVVALNADRWRGATSKWTGTLSTYRRMLINHEVGHLLGLHHPPNPQCPRPGEAARVMSQQSTELNGCLPNPWPLAAEIERAGQHDLPLAPPPD